MSILVYDGLRELIKREFIDRNMATTDATVDSATNLIRTVMEDYRGKALQLVGTTLPSTGVPGTIYLQSKSEPNEKNRFIAYAFEGGKFVQVGSSFFPEDFAPDSELNINSQVTVENRVLKSAIDDKFNLSGVINNVIPTEPNSVHAKDTPTSAAIQAELATKLGYEDGSRITQEQLWEIFRPELTRPVYPYIKLILPNLEQSSVIRLEGHDMLTGLKYKTGFGSDIYTRGPISREIAYNGTFLDINSDREIRIRLTNHCEHEVRITDRMYDAEQYPSEYTIAGESRSEVQFYLRFLDPVSIGCLRNLKINFKIPSNSIHVLKVTTQISDTGEDYTYTNVQNNVQYGSLYTEGIPFYGFN